MADFPPTHPGEVLREDYLKPLSTSQYAVANAISVPQIRISEIINGKRAITPDTALRLARHFRTSCEFWVGMQATYDLERAEDEVGRKIGALGETRAETSSAKPGGEEPEQTP
jgi:addiction module HigA family antidote